MKLPSIVLCAAGAMLAATAASAQTEAEAAREAGAMSLPLSAYPEESLENGEEGTVEYLVDVDAEGTLRSCEILTSSGHGRLDRATCELMIQHARFEPARSADGRALESMIRGTVVWKLPDSAALNSDG
jgi:TonB family protein